MTASGGFNPDFTLVKALSDATLEVWSGPATNARYIHFAEINPSWDGGFVLADGELTLEMIRNTEIKAEMVMITAVAPPDVQLSRVRALLDSGAQTVAVTLWEVPPPALERLADGFYAALNRDRSTTRALGQGRETLLRDALGGQDYNDPSVWGGLVLFAAP